MEKIAIVLDSCGDVSDEFLNDYDIFQIPTVIMCNEQEYKDRINIEVEDVYEMQKSYMLKTASPTGQDKEDVFALIKEKGYTHVLCIMLSSGLSSTYNSMRLYAQSVEDLTVEVIDSKSASVGYGVTAITLAKLIKEGKSFLELVSIANYLVANTYPFFSIQDLDLLARGGRIGKATAFVGGLAKVKPILTFDSNDGEISVASKVIGHKKVAPKLISLIDDEIKKHPGVPFQLVVADGGLREERDALEKILLEKYPQCTNMLYGKIGAPLSVYIGKGVLGAGVQFLGY